MDYEAQLAAEGLSPLDVAGKVSNKGSGKPKDINTVLEREQGAALIEEAADIAKARWLTAEERGVMRAVASGIGLKGAARTLGIPYTRARVAYILVVGEWRTRTRKAPTLTRARFMRADPMFLLQLLRALT